MGRHKGKRAYVDFHDSGLGTRSKNLKVELEKENQVLGYLYGRDFLVVEYTSAPMV
jgi:hypothetical protein